MEPFGRGSVVMSIIAFVIARKEYAPIVFALLFVNGGLIVAGMVALIAQGALASEDSSNTLRTIGSTTSNGGNSNRARRMEGCNRQKTTRYKEKRLAQK